MQRSSISATRSAAQASVDTGTSEVAFSRPTGAITIEKNDVPLKTHVNERLADDLRRFARDHGYSSVSDLVRELLTVAMYGSAHLVSLHAARIDALAQNLVRNRDNSEGGR